MEKVCDVNWIQLARDKYSWNVRLKLIAILRIREDPISNFVTKVRYRDCKYSYFSQSYYADTDLVFPLLY